MYERLTDRARKVAQLANQEALRFNHEYVAPEHFVLGMIKEGTGVAANVLKNLDVGINLRTFRKVFEEAVGANPSPDQIVMGRLPHTPHAKKLIEHSVEVARELTHDYIGTEHLLLGACRLVETTPECGLKFAFDKFGLTPHKIQAEILDLLGKPQSADLARLWDTVKEADRHATEAASKVLEKTYRVSKDGLRCNVDVVMMGTETLSEVEGLISAPSDDICSRCKLQTVEADRLYTGTNSMFCRPCAQTLPGVVESRTADPSVTSVPRSWYSPSPEPVRKVEPASLRVVDEAQLMEGWYQLRDGVETVHPYVGVESLGNGCYSVPHPQPEPVERDSYRRIKQVGVPRDHVIQFVSGQARYVAEGIPADVEVLEVHENHDRREFVLTLRHDSFPVHQDGLVVERLNVTWRTVEGG